MTVLEAKSRMTPCEAASWMAYFRKNGYSSHSGGSIPEIQNGFALLASIMINVNGGYKGGKTAKPEDFLPDRLKSQEGDHNDVMAILASQWSGASDKPKKKRWKRPG